MYLSGFADTATDTANDNLVAWALGTGRDVAVKANNPGLNQFLEQESRLNSGEAWTADMLADEASRKILTALDIDTGTNQARVEQGTQGTQNLISRNVVVGTIGPQPAPPKSNNFAMLALLGLAVLFLTKK